MVGECGPVGQGQLHAAGTTVGTLDTTMLQAALITTTPSSVLQSNVATDNHAADVNFVHVYAQQQQATPTASSGRLPSRMLHLYNCYCTQVENKSTQPSVRCGVIMLEHRVQLATHLAPCPQAGPQAARCSISPDEASMLLHTTISS